MAKKQGVDYIKMALSQEVLDKKVIKIWGMNERTIKRWKIPIPDIEPKKIEQLLLSGMTLAGINQKLNLPTRYIETWLRERPDFRENTERKKQQRKIKALRKLLTPCTTGKMTQRALAKELGVHENTVCQWSKKLSQSQLKNK